MNASILALLRPLSRVAAVSAVIVTLWTGNAAAVPIEISSVNDLAGMSNNLSADYVLGRNIDASVTSTWNGGAGFLPIGTSANPFRGSFDGKNFGISNPFINSPAQGVGLFGHVTGSVQNLTLQDARITGTSANQAVGGIAGQNRGVINSVQVTGSVTALGERSYAGGVVGLNLSGAQVAKANAVVTVAGNTTAVVGCCTDHGVGGIVGNNNGAVTQSRAGGSVAGGPLNASGGLVGTNRGTISTSIAETTVSENGGYAGGLVGLNRSGSIAQSYALGAVTNNHNAAGGLIGLADLGGSITQTYAAGAVAGGQDNGGLIGFVGFGGVSVTASYWDTQATGLSASARGTGLTTAELQSGTLPNGFDPGVWNATSGKYPTLIAGLPGIEPPRLFGLAIGQNDLGGIGAVRGDNAARSVLDVLRTKSNWWSIDADDAGSLYAFEGTPNASLASFDQARLEVEAKLDAFSRVVRPGDTFVFYANVHADSYGPSGNLELADATGNTHDEWFSFGMSDDALSNYFASRPEWNNVRKIFLLDTCHAGGFWGIPSPDDEGDLDRLSNVAVFASAYEHLDAYTVPGTGVGLWTDELLLPALRSSELTGAQLKGLTVNQANFLLRKYWFQELNLLDFNPPGSTALITPDTDFSSFFAASPDFSLGQPLFSASVNTPPSLVLFAVGLLCFATMCRRQSSAQRVT